MPPLMLCQPYAKKNLFDQYWANVSLLMHYDGANNSVAFPDSSTQNIPFTRNAPAVVSTNRSKFGGTSLNTNGSGRIRTTAWHEALWFGGDFTIECWVNTNNLTGVGFVATLGEGFGIGYAMWSLMRSGTAMYFVTNHTDAASSVIVGQAFGTLAQNAWHHVAVTRQGNNWRFFFDGVLSATVVNAAVPYKDTTKRFSIGGDNAGEATRFFDGYIDEMRLTKGVARYTGNFTVPDKQFVHSAS